VIIIGELINATRKKVKEAVTGKDTGFIQSLAQRQDEAGAHYIDVCVALGSGELKKEIEDMEWAIKAIRLVSSKPLAIDTTSWEVLEAALKMHGPGAMINSISAEKGRFKPYLKLAKEYDALAVVLPVTEAGIPKDTETRLQNATTILSQAEKEGLNRENLYFDPLVLPLGVHQNNGLVTLDTLRLFKEELGVKTTLGLTNISYGLPVRSLLNRTFLTLAIGWGVDSALVNPLDKALMSSLFAAEALLGKDPYCSKFLQLFRQNKLTN
jgi:5-methyltetrahydrofolate--homocysteine methyltransferase